MRAWVVEDVAFELWEGQYEKEEDEEKSQPMRGLQSESDPN